MTEKTNLQHLGEAIMLTGKAEAAAANGNPEKAEELDFEADFELGLIDDEPQSR